MALRFVSLCGLGALLVTSLSVTAWRRTTRPGFPEQATLRFLHPSVGTLTRQRGYRNS